MLILCLHIDRTAFTKESIFCIFRLLFAIKNYRLHLSAAATGCRYPLWGVRPCSFASQALACFAFHILLLSLLTGHEKSRLQSFLQRQLAAISLFKGVRPCSFASQAFTCFAFHYFTVILYDCFP